MAELTIPDVPSSQVPVVTRRLTEGGATNISTTPQSNGATTITAETPEHAVPRPARTTVSKSIRD